MELLPETRARKAEFSHNGLAKSNTTKPAAVLSAEMLATMSHELRSPLTSIKGYAATLLLQEPHISAEEKREFLQAVKDASERLETIIDQLLEIGELETGAVTLEQVPVNVAYLVREAIAIQEFHLLECQKKQPRGKPHKEFVFRLRCEDNNGRPTPEEPVFQTDRRRLREVLDQLLENAVLNSPEGGVIQVTIRTFEQSQISDYNASIGRDMSAPHLSMEKRPALEIRVSDQGTGIPPAQLEQIFEHFHRVDTRLIREAGGLGLGLTICKKLVELQHGRIWVESEVGKGSTFYIWLPDAA